jgi:hypothetical protein
VRGEPNAVNELRITRAHVLVEHLVWQPASASFLTTET